MPADQDGVGVGDAEALAGLLGIPARAVEDDPRMQAQDLELSDTVAAQDPSV